jgi:hypothetical protein
MKRFGRTAAWLLAATASVVTTGCLFAAGAGAAGAVYFTDRGAESLLDESVDKTYDAARETFQELGIRETKTSSEADKRELEGSVDDRELTVKIERQDQSTKVEVVARKTRVTWDKDYAKMVLEKIVSRAT